MKELLELRDQGKLNPHSAAWFKSPKPGGELYDVKNDPEELHNLAVNPQYTGKLNELREAFTTWTREVGDMSEIPEKEMILDLWWNGKGEAAQTAWPTILTKAQGVKIKCTKKGASIGYRILPGGKEVGRKERVVRTWDSSYPQINGKKIKSKIVWQVYDGEIISLEKSDKLLVNAMRIGYKPATIEYVQK